MKELVFATVFMCMGSFCEQHDVKVEKKACSFGTIHAQVPHDGEYKDGSIGIKCKS